MASRRGARGVLAAGVLAVTAAGPPGGAGARAAPPARPAATAAAPSLGRAISLAEVQAAAARSPTHTAAALRRAAARAGVDAAGGFPEPSVALSTSHRTARLGILGSLPLPIFGTIGAAERVAEAEYEVAGAEARAIDIGLQREVTRAWLELARAEARVAIARHSAERATQLELVTRTRLEAGDASRAEAVAAGAAASRARTQAEAEAGGVVAASATVAGLVGWDPEALLHVAGGLPPLPAPPPLAELRARRDRHPDLRTASARAVAEGARVDAVRKARWPTLALEGEAMLDDPTLPDDRDPGDDDYRVGLSMTVPLFARSAARVRAAEDTLRAARAERRAAAAAIDGQLVASYARYQAARARAGALERAVLPAQREAAALARAAYREGQGGLVDVLSADATLAGVEGETADAAIDAAAARAELEWAVGGAL